VGDRLERELLLESFEAAGYERTETVVEVGQWSVRGGIVDVFAPSHPSPVRLEFFGDDVESIRRFDPTSQRSTDALDELLLLPLGGPADDTDGAARLLDYVPADAPAILDAPALLDETSEEAPNRRPLRAMLGDRPRVELETVAGTGVEYVLDTQEVPRFTAHFAPLTDALGRWRAEGFTVRLVAGDEHQAEHLKQILRDHDVETPIAPALDAPDPLSIVVGECSAGIMISAVGLVVLTEAEIFGARRRTLRRPKYQRGAALTAFTDLEVNDLVVHEDHGIGRYLGLRTMSVGDRDGDFLLLEYAEAVGCTCRWSGSTVSKYLGGDAGTAKLDRMGGASWQRVKESVRAALREMAEAAEALRPARGGRGSPLRDRLALAAGVRGVVSLRGDARSAARDRRDQARHGEHAADGPPGGRRRRLRQDEVALRAAFKAVGDGTRSRCWCPRPCSRSSTGRPSPTASGPSRPRSSCSRASARPRSRRRWWRACARARSTWSSALTVCCPRTCSSSGSDS
jgi:transcription-repair coupling factor (superfamily II helicase)